jgi:hypothetical protein
MSLCKLVTACTLCLHPLTDSSLSMKMEYFSSVVISFAELCSNKFCSEPYLVKRISSNFIPHLCTNDNWNVCIGMEA